MPFKEINVNDIIEKQKKDDPEFEKAWTESRMEYDIIGQIIKLRKQQELSQKELAEKIQKSQQAVSRVENKEVSPSLKLICSIVDSLGYELKIVPKK